MEVVSWIGFSQAFFSGLLTLTKGEKSIADRLLSAWLFLLAFDFLLFALESEVFPNFILLTNSFLLFNPALYLYTCSLTNRNFVLKWNQLLHLVPYFFFKASAWIAAEPQSFENYFFHDNTLWFRLLFGIVATISWVVYLFITAKMLTKHRKSIKNEFSTIDLFKRVGWIHFVVIFYIIFCLLSIFWGLFDIIVFDTRSITIFNYSVLLFFIYVLAFYGLKQRDIFRKKEKNTDEKQASQLLSNDYSEELKKKLLLFFETNKPYLNPDLNMSVLSDNLKIPKHHLTEVMNKNLGRNFFQFVNEYRIEAVKKILIDSKNQFSIEAIGYECGFNSKSTFYSVFKGITGKTPMEFKRDSLSKKTPRF